MFIRIISVLASLYYIVSHATWNELTLIAIATIIWAVFFTTPSHLYPEPQVSVCIWLGLSALAVCFFYTMQAIIGVSSWWNVAGMFAVTALARILAELVRKRVQGSNRWRHHQRSD